MKAASFLSRTRRASAGELGLLAALVAASYVLRVFLFKIGGGAGYWPDEVRYTRDVLSVIQGCRDAGGCDGKDLFFSILGGIDHAGFRLIGAIPAFIQTRFGLGLDAALAFFSFFSALNVAWVSAIARRCGASSRAALLAAACAAASNSLFYFSRHLLPYDAAIFFGLAGVWLVLRGRRISDSEAFSAGLCSFLCVFTHTGSWSLAILPIPLLLVQGLLDGGVGRAQIRSVAFLMIGVLAPVAALAAVQALFPACRYFASAPLYAGVFSSGDFTGGWIQPWRYFLASERGIFLLWLASAVLACAALAKGSGDRRAFCLPLSAVMIIYALLLLASHGANKFIVLGRMARPMAPFFCVLFGLAAERALEIRGKNLRPGARRFALAGAAALVLAQAAYNFADAFGPRFPDAVLREILPLLRGRGVLRASRFEFLDESAIAPTARPDYWLVDSAFIPVVESPEFLDATAARPHGTIVYRARHPATFRPYHFDGYSPRDQARLRSGELLIELIKNNERGGG